jgi:hypothetical protein
MNKLILCSCIYSECIHKFLAKDTCCVAFDEYLSRFYAFSHMGFIEVKKVHFELNIIKFLTKLSHYVLIVNYIIYMNPIPSLAHINRNLLLQLPL